MEYEILCGILSGAAVAPAVSIVDKAIFSNASGRQPLLACIYESAKTLVRQPGQFFRSPSFLWIWGVYGFTYIVANCTERYHINKGEIGTSTAQTNKFVATSAANISASLIKDRAFSQMYGVTAPRPLPPAAALCYAVRDMMTVGASFTLVDPISRWMVDRYGLNLDRAKLSAQLACPLAAQVFNTPIFLLGMSLYNSPGGGWGIHQQAIRQHYFKTLGSRIARIAPAFSIGGVLNRTLRDLHDWD